MITIRLKKSGIPWLEYLAISLIIFLPLLIPGYIQTFDMAWGPHIMLPKFGDNSWLLMHVIDALSAALTSMATQKLLLIGIFMLGAVGAHHLSLLSKLVTIPSAAYIAGLLYMFNPFIYTRLMAGQWLVLLGYALLPWVVLSTWNLLQEPSFKRAAILAGWLIAISYSSIHTIGIALLAIIVISLATGKQKLWDAARYIAVAATTWLLLSALWLVLFITSDSRLDRIAGFGPSQLKAFMTGDSIAGSVPLTTLSLQGFWADAQGRYVLPSSLGWWFYGVLIALAILVLYGAVRVIRHRDRLGIALLIAGVVAWWLSMGVASSWSAWFTHWLIGHVPLYAGYREPQKWLMLLVVAYSYLAACGLAGLLGRLAQARRQYVVGAALLMPILLTPMLLWGAGHQLRSSQYPRDYQTAKQNLQAADGQTLVFPWHMYLPVSYAGRVVANPAPHYFGDRVITGDNPELAGVPPVGSGGLYSLVSNQLLPQRRERTDAAQQLAPYNVSHILLLKEADWQRYDWLNKQTGLTIVQDTPSLRLYKLEGNR